MSTRESIIEAATWLFAEKGYEKMTMKEIANRVGITPPAVYAFYKNKEDVFMQIYKEVLSGHLKIASYSTKDFEHKTVKELLDDFLQAIMEFQMKEQIQIKVFMRLLLFPPEVFEKDLKKDLLDVEEKEHEMFCRIFEWGIQKGEIKEGNCSVYATTLLCIMDGLFWEMQRLDEETFRNRIIIVWEHFWQGIKR